MSFIHVFGSMSFLLQEAGSNASQFLVFWGMAILFSRKMRPVDNPITVSNILYSSHPNQYLLLLFFVINARLCVSYCCFDFHFPKMHSIFYVWLFTSLLWGNFYLFFSPSFLISSPTFWWHCMLFSYKFLPNTLYSLYISS